MNSFLQKSQLLKINAKKGTLSRAKVLPNNDMLDSFLKFYC